MSIGICDKNDKHLIKALYMQAFEDNAEFVEYYFEDKLEDNVVIGIKEKNKLLSMLHLNPFKVNFNKQIYNISYIVAVATDKEHRKKGLMGQIIDFTLNKLYLDGEIFSLLMPIDSRIYERYGFGFIEDHLKLDCNSKTFMMEEVQFKDRVARVEDIPLLVKYYNTFSQQFNLSTNRNEKSFDRLFKEIVTDNGQIILFEDGYIMTYYDNDKILNIREIVYNSDVGLREILSYIKDRTSSARVIIHDHLKSKIKYLLPNIDENNIILQPFMMARIINVEKFIRENISLFSDNIYIKITDNFIKENNNVYHIKDKQVIIDYKLDDKKSNIIELNIKQLTQLAFGYIELWEIEGLKNRSIFNKDLNKIHFFNEYV